MCGTLFKGDLFQMSLNLVQHVDRSFGGGGDAVVLCRIFYVLMV